MTDFFADLKPVPFAGIDSDEDLVYRHYNATEVLGDKTMAEHLRFAVCYWHNFVWPGSDPFGGQTFERPWFEDTMEAARLKADTAFEMFGLLQQPFFCFHDFDIRPEGRTLVESNSRLDEMADYIGNKMELTGTGLLWGTANLFSHRRYMAGAATNPDPRVFAYAAATVRQCLEVTHRLGGENYVLWGGREGYETLLNTDLKKELNQYGRFLSMVVEHKHKIGFDGAILIEPKPQEPTKHQYDFDTATVYGFLKRFGLENEVKVNIETGHAVLAGHSFEHELATANALGIFGSIDANRNDYQSGWDTDQFPNNVAEMALAFYHIIDAGGFVTGGTNFDTKIRRQSLAPEDLLYAHIGAMDVCAQAFKVAWRMHEDGALAGPLAERYAGWDEPWAAAMLHEGATLESIADQVLSEQIEPTPLSGRQELLENIVNRYC